MKKTALAVSVVLTLLGLIGCGGKITENVSDSNDSKVIEVKEEKSPIAGSYVRFSVEEFETGDGSYDAITSDERLIINPDGTGIYSAQDTIPIVKVTKDKIIDESGNSMSYVAKDDTIILTDGDVVLTFVKSNLDVAADEETLMKTREEYCNPDAEDRKVIPGIYKETYADEYTDGWYVFSSILTVNEDMSASTMFQDIGPEFVSISDGKAVDVNGTEYDCVVSHDTISIAFGTDWGYSGYTTFVRVQ